MECDLKSMMQEKLYYTSKEPVYILHGNMLVFYKVVVNFNFYGKF